LLEGSAGTGKTFTLNTLIQICQAEGIPIEKCAATGIAATRLKGATTAHSLFGIPISDNGSGVLTSTVAGDTYKGRLLKHVQIFIIDEVGMLRIDVIKAIDNLLRFIHDVPSGEQHQFGRVIFIFTGDVRQIMPILPNRVDPLGAEQTETSFFFSPYVAPHLINRHTLTQNMRLDPQAEEFKQFQYDVGADRLPHVVFSNDVVHQYTRYIEIPEWMARYNETAFINEVFPQEVLDLSPNMSLIKRVIISAVNADVDRINALIAARMPADRPSHTYLSTNIAGEHDIHNPENAVFSAENMQNIVNPSLPHHSLTLKVGTPVMCMQNIDVPNGLANGAMMVVTRVDSDIVWCLVNNRHGIVELPIIPTAFDFDNNNGFTFTRTQLPLRIAFAVTNHRSQGGTYDTVGVHSLHPVWYHGGLFVAVTRCTTAAGFSILVRMHTSDFPHPTVRNVVHPRVSGDSDCLCGCKPFLPDPNGPPPPPPPGPQATVDEEDIDEDVPFGDYIPTNNRS
jgi:hypothetical protein